MKQYKHIFFDLDRTLWDFEKNSSDTLIEIIDKFSLKPFIKDNINFIKSFEYYNNRLWNYYREGKISKYLLRQERFRLLLNRYGIKDHELVGKISKFYLDNNPVKTALIENAKETLQYLSGKYKIHIITNGFYDVQKTKLIKSGISSYFTKVFTSDRIGYAKPKADIFDYAVRSLNAHKNECVMVGDDETNDIAGAMNARIDQVYFNPTGKEIKITPTYEIKRLSDLIALF